MSFTVPLPIAAAFIFLAGALYSLWKYRKTIKTISKNQDRTVHQAYKNYHLYAHGYSPSYLPLDPDREMESLAKNWVVRLYSRKYANLIYARVLDCIDTHRFMLQSIQIDNKLSTSEHFNQSYMKNVQLFFFLIAILQLKNKERQEQFELFSLNPNHLYDLNEGYFKNFTTLSYDSSN